MLGEGICCPGNACFAPMRRLDARGLWRVRAPPAPDLPAGMRGDARYMMCAMRISATWWRRWSCAGGDFLATGSERCACAWMSGFLALAHACTRLHMDAEGRRASRSRIRALHVDARMDAWRLLRSRTHAHGCTRMRGGGAWVTRGKGPQRARATRVEATRHDDTTRRDSTQHSLRLVAHTSM